MANSDQIDKLEKSLDKMGDNLNSIKTELSTIQIDRKQLETENLVQKIGDVSDTDIFYRQLQLAQEENRDLAYDLQEWKTSYDEKCTECEQIREKYLQTQQIAEEYRCQLDLLNKSNNNDMDQMEINCNLQLANERFKEQIEEYSHMQFILETKQIELQDSASKLKLAEATIEAISNDMENCIVKWELLKKELEAEESKNLKLQLKQETLIKENEEWNMKYDEISKENDLLMKSVEKMNFLEDCLNSKTKEVYELSEHLESLREESLRHVGRIKDRAETQKRAFQTQISGMEKELVQLRANLSAAFREREDIKQRMQGEIYKLEQKFNDAQVEIRSLKTHVEIIKSSYANIFENLELSP